MTLSTLLIVEAERRLCLAYSRHVVTFEAKIAIDVTKTWFLGYNVIVDSFNYTYSQLACAVLTISVVATLSRPAFVDTKFTIGVSGALGMGLA